MHHLHGTVALLLSPSVGVALLLQVAESDVRARNSGLLYLVLWYLSIVPVLTLKSVAGRRRPVASDPKHIGDEAAAAAGCKALSKIPAMHKAGDGNSSFPSGDVAVWRSPTRCFVAPGPRSASSRCVRLHRAVGFWPDVLPGAPLLDVTIGGLCAALMGLLFEFVSTGLVGDVCTMPRQWWEPAAALACSLCGQRRPK